MFKKEICLFAFFFPAAVFAVTIDELQEATSKNTASISQMHVIYVVESNNYRRQNKKLSPETIELFKKAGQSQPTIDMFQTANSINCSRKEKIECFYDIETKDMKEITTDLRDIPRLLKENNLPAKEKRNVCQTQTILKDSDHNLTLKPAENYIDNKASLILETNERVGFGSTRVVSLGIFPSYYLTEAYNSTISEQVDGKLKVEAISGKQKEYKSVIMCAPSLGHRICSTKSYKGKNLISETLLDEYKIIDGTPFPFYYMKKTYDENGKVATEKTYKVEQVEFNQTFSPDTFKVTISDGAMFQDFAISGASAELGKEGFWSVEGGFWSLKELCEIATKAAEKYGISTKSTPLSD